MAYATPAQFRARYDARRLGQLIRDDGTTATAAAIDADAIIQAMLDDGAGIIVATTVRAGRYSEADLTALTGNSLSLLIRINCDLAFYLLSQRRPMANLEGAEAALKLADSYLKQLAEGEMIFGLPATVAAGLPTTTGLSSDVSGVLESGRRIFGDTSLLS